MIAGDFNVHVLTNDPNSDFSAAHNSPLQTALRLLLDSTRLIITQCWPWLVVPTHCQRWTSLQLSLFSSLQPSCHNAHSVVPVQWSLNGGLHLQFLPAESADSSEAPRKVLFSIIHQDIALLVTGRPECPWHCPRDAAGDFPSAVLVTAASNTSMLLEACPVSDSFMALLPCHERFDNAHNKLGKAHAQLFHSSTPLLIDWSCWEVAVASEGPMAPIPQTVQGWTETPPSKAVCDSVSSIDTKLDPSATSTKIWLLVNKFCKQAISTSPD